MSSLIFTIGEVAQLAGVTPKTLRHYHQIGLLPEPARDVNNYRVYSIDQLEKVQLILRLKDIGLSLKQIKSIFEANDPDTLMRTVLHQHERRITNEISELQSRLENLQQYLNTDATLLSDFQQGSPDYSAMTIVTDTVKRKSSGLSDLLYELENDVLTKIDAYPWTAEYEVFWHQVGTHLVTNLAKQESLLIFWMERYLALKNMESDDLQTQAWLQQLDHSQERPLLSQAFSPPAMSILPERDQYQIQKMLFSMLYEEGSTPQKEFLKVLLRL